jgi:hypothetical protein
LATHKIARAATSVALDQIGNAADENLTKLKSVDCHGFVGNALSVEEPNDMVGRITDLDVLLDDELTVLIRNLKGNVLLLPGKRISRQRNSQAKQCGGN